MLASIIYNTPPQCVSIYLSKLSDWHVFRSREINIVDPNQLASQKPVDLDLHSFHFRSKVKFKQL